MTQKVPQKFQKEISLQKSAPKVAKAWGGGQTFLEEVHNYAAQVCMKTVAIIDFYSDSDFQNVIFLTLAGFMTEHSDLKKCVFIYNTKFARRHC